MTRADILAAVVRLYAGDGEENEDTALLNQLDDELPHSDISDLIFHDFRGLTPEQVVEEAVRRERSMPTKPGGGDVLGQADELIGLPAVLDNPCS